MDELHQTQDPMAGTSIETNPEAGTDQLGLPGDGTTADLGIPGLETLPEDRQRAIQESFLRKHNELNEARRAAQEKEDRYFRAIEALQARRAPEAPEPALSPDQEFAGLNAYQIIEKMAERVADKKFQALIDQHGLSDVRPQVSTIVRQLEILDAQQAYPDVMRYQDQLTQLGQALEKEYGPKGASKISVLDMMGMLKAREARANVGKRQNGQSRSVVPAQRTPTPQAAITRPGTSTTRVADISRPKDTGDALRLAMKELGLSETDIYT